MSNDHAALMRLVFDYADAVVARDAEAWAATWAPDAVWTLGPERVFTGRDAIASQWRDSIERVAHVNQLYLSNDYAVDGDTAVGRVQLVELVRMPDGSASTLAGHYDDSFVRIDGRWQFASRSLTIRYRGAPDLSGTFFP